MRYLLPEVVRHDSSRMERGTADVARVTFQHLQLTASWHRPHLAEPRPATKRPFNTRLNKASVEYELSCVHTTLTTSVSELRSDIIILSYLVGLVI